MEPFSVLMSLYIKENPKYLMESLESICTNTVLPNEIVLVLDGPITDELQTVINEYVLRFPSLFNIVPLEKNQGLGLALREGMLHCKNELVARMDTDDICRSDRFEKQLSVFEENPNIDVCGSHILEFEDSVDNIVAKRVVPLTNDKIKKYQKRRDGFNHVSVMFKKSSVLKAGNYQSCLLMEDTLLWANMFNSGATGINIDDYLVYVRIGKDMFERRGGFSYYKKYKAGRKMVYQTHFISWWDYKWTIFIQFLVAMMPNKIRGWVFKKMLHHK